MLSRTLRFRNLRGLNVSCGTEQVSVLLWSVLKTKLYTAQWVRDPKNHVRGLKYYNFRNVFEPPPQMSVHQSELNSDFEADSRQEPGVEGFLSGTSQRVNEDTQTNPLHPTFSQFSPVHIPHTYPSSTKWQLYK